MPPLIQYTSFLIRMWRVSGRDTDQLPGTWRSEVEHIPSSRSWSFTSLDEMLAFLKQQTEDSESLAQIEEIV